MVTHTKTVFFFPPCWSGKKYPSIYLCTLLFVNQMAWWHFPVAFLHLWNFLMNVNSGGGSVSTFKRSNTWPEVVLGVGGRQRRLTFTISFRSHSGYREGFECTVSVVVRLQRFHCQGKKKNITTKNAVWLVHLWHCTACTMLYVSCVLSVLSLTRFKKAFYLQQTENEETLEMTSPTPRL